MSIKTSDFDYYLPENQIAQCPSLKRDESRLMYLNPFSQTIQHYHFFEIADLLKKGDLLVLNNTRVLPARLIGIKEDTGITCEVLLLKRLSKNTWETLVKPGRRLKIGARVVFVKEPNLSMVVEQILDNGNRIVRFEYEGIFEERLDEAGKMPLPPYIHETLEDKERYQTVYAKEQGSAAAPTAGLHFTNELLEKLKAKGVEIAEVTLHVGLGTFRPVKVDDIANHFMHSESFSLSKETSLKINKALSEKRRVIAVGTTTTRVLETLATEVTPNEWRVRECQGETDIFIYPGKKMRIIDGLITNFHLPKSTLLMLVATLTEKDFILQAYEKAVKEGYRFFSFGDAMFIDGNKTK